MAEGSSNSANASASSNAAARTLPPPTKLVDAALQNARKLAASRAALRKFGRTHDLDQTTVESLETLPMRTAAQLIATFALIMPKKREDKIQAIRAEIVKARGHLKRAVFRPGAKQKLARASDDGDSHIDPLPAPQTDGQAVEQSGCEAASQRRRRKFIRIPGDDSLPAGPADGQTVGMSGCEPASCTSAGQVAAGHFVEGASAKPPESKKKMKKEKKDKKEKKASKPQEDPACHPVNVGVQPVCQLPGAFGFPRPAFPPPWAYAYPPPMMGGMAFAWRPVRSESKSKTPRRSKRKSRSLVKTRRKSKSPVRSKKKRAKRKRATTSSPSSSSSASVSRTKRRKKGDKPKRSPAQPEKTSTMTRLSKEAVKPSRHHRQGSISTVTRNKSEESNQIVRGEGDDAHHGRLQALLSKLEPSVGTVESPPREDSECEFLEFEDPLAWECRSGIVPETKSLSNSWGGGVQSDVHVPQGSNLNSSDQASEREAGGHVLAVESRQDTGIGDDISEQSRHHADLHARDVAGSGGEVARTPPSIAEHDCSVSMSAAPLDHHLNGEVGCTDWPQDSRERRLHDWLSSLDSGRGKMLIYFDALRTGFDANFSMIRAVILEKPISPGAIGFIDPFFWEACDVKLLGHRLLLASAITALESEAAPS